MDNIRKFQLLRQAIKCGCLTCKSTIRNISVAQAMIRKANAADDDELSFNKKIAAQFVEKNILIYYETLEKNLALHESKPIKSGTYIPIKNGRIVTNESKG